VTFRIDHPEWLWCAVILPPLLVLGWRATSGFDPLRRLSAIGLRSIVFVGLLIVLAGPRAEREHDHLTVIGLFDVSGSVRRFAELPADADITARSTLDYLKTWFREAADVRRPDDRVGLIVFDGEALAMTTPTRGELIDDAIDVRRREGTNIADAIELGLAMFPVDTARRLVLVTDGNETAGDALLAARRAAGGDDARLETGTRIPIDVLPISYNVDRDVQVVRVDAPPSAQPGQTITVRMILESSAPVSGRLILMREGRPVDLNGRASGTSRRVELPAGRSVERADVQLDESPVNRFRAIFEPDDLRDDEIRENNDAESFTVTPGKGSILIVDRARDVASEHPLERMLANAELPIDRIEPEGFPTDLLTLQSYDLVVLDDVPAYDFSPFQHQLMQRYVEDLGGGLIMVGGTSSFGAGGWNGTPVEDILPVELDPPRELRLPTAALVLVIDKSGSMRDNVAGARATKQDVANEGAALAIESLRSESLIGVVAFDYDAYEIVPLQRNHDPTALADRVRGVVADGGTAFFPALSRAYDMLKDAPVAKKRIVLLSDGQSEGFDPTELVRANAEKSVKLTTIAVGDDADSEALRLLADIGEGEFYEVRDPARLPRVLVDSVQVINKPLVKEVPFTPIVRPTGSSLTVGMTGAPTVRGLVITAPKPDPRAIVEMTHDDAGGEPLLAHWQAGLGRVAAFTSDLGQAWTRSWLDWAPGERFWLQLVRMTTRPTQSRDTELLVALRGDRLTVTLDAATEEGYLDDLRVEGTVYRPDGETTTIRLRQTAPGRYAGEADAPVEGNYIVAVTPRGGARRLAPTIGGASRATSPEFRRTQSNVSLLDDIASLTDGRVLDLRTPQAVNLYDRTNLPRRVSTQAIWPLLLSLILVVFLMDVATRRIAWDRGTIARVTSRSLAMVRLSTADRTSAGTLSSLRKVAERFDAQQQQTSTDGASRSSPTPTRRFVRQATSSTSQDTAEALRSLKGRSTSTPPASATSRDDTPATPNTGGSETTSGLLAAKRRARQRMQGNDESSE